MGVGRQDRDRTEPLLRLPLPRGAAELWNEAIEHLSGAAAIMLCGVDPKSESVSGLLARDGYDLHFSRNGAEMLAAAEDRRVDLFILNASLPDGLVTCHRAKRDPKIRLIPILMLLDRSDPDWQVLALEAGADDLLSAPYEQALLRSRVRSLLRHKSAVDQLEQTETILFSLAQAIEEKDQAIGGHCERIATFSVALGMSLGLPRAHLLALFRGGYLHDIGKVAIPDSILFKPGRLTPAEWEVMKTHTIKGEEICRSLKSLAPVLPIIRSHHERWDGGGYPDGLRGAEIPLLARILQLADVYDALVSPRPYKRDLTAPEALDIMWQETAQGWRDPSLMEAFQALHQTHLLHAAQEERGAWRSVDTVRASLLNLARRLSMDRGASPADSRDSLLEVRKQVTPILDTG
jgi:putative two-component system response regulator